MTVTIVLALAILGGTTQIGSFLLTKESTVLTFAFCSHKHICVQVPGTRPIIWISSFKWKI